MNNVSRVSLLLPLLLLSIVPLSISFAQGEVSQDMLDSIAVQMNRSDQYFDTVNFRMESITHRLKKSGEITESDTTFMYAVLENGEHSIFLTESDGTIIDEVNQDNGDEESEEVTMESPLGAFSREERNNYTFSCWNPMILPVSGLRLNRVMKISTDFQGYLRSLLKHGIQLSCREVLQKCRVL